MRKYCVILYLIYLIVFSPFLSFSSERPHGIVVPVVTLGNVSETRRQILQNTLVESLGNIYRLVPQDKFEEIQEKIFQEMDYYECTEDQCILMIQEALQVENLFLLQVIGEGSNTQLSLKWVGLDDKKIKNEFCINCNTKQLNMKIEILVRNLINEIPENINLVKLEANNVEKVIKINEENKKDYENNMRFTFRTIGVVNAIDYKINKKSGIGLLNQNQTTTVIEESEIKEKGLFNGIYSMYSLTECYFCDNYGIVSLVGSGNTSFITKDGSSYNYKMSAILLLFGYQWFYEYGLSFVVLGGLVMREYTKDSFNIINYNSEDEQKIKNYVNQQKSNFYPAFLFGYSF